MAWTKELDSRNVTHILPCSEGVFVMACHDKVFLVDSLTGQGIGSPLTVEIRHPKKVLKFFSSLGIDKGKSNIGNGHTIVICPNLKNIIRSKPVSQHSILVCEQQKRNYIFGTCRWLRGCELQKQQIGTRLDKQSERSHYSFACS